MEITYDENGKALVQHIDGVDYPAELTFEVVNDFVHDAEYEDLQYLCLGLIAEIEEMRKNRLNAHLD